MNNPELKRARIRKHLQLFAITLTGLVLSIVGYFYSAQLESRQRQTSVSHLMEERQAQLETRIATTVETLDAVGSFISNTDELSPRAFKNFTSPILNRHPEFWAIHWAPRIDHQQRPQFEQALNERGFSKGITELEPITNWVIPSSQKRQYYPVQLSEPLERNQTIIGFDASSRQLSNDVIKQILNRNINFLSSTPFKLIQDNDGSASVVFFRPVFDTQPAPADPALRAKNIRGFILALVKPQTVLNMLAMKDQGITMRLMDIDNGTVSNIGSIGADQIKTSWITQQANFASQGREWQLEVAIAPDQSFLMDTSNRANWVLATGLGFTFLLALILHRLSQAHLQISLERDRARSYLETVETIMMAVDMKGRITMMNRKGSEIFGYSQQEMINSLWFSPRYQPTQTESQNLFLEGMKHGNLPEALRYTESTVLNKEGNELLIAWHNQLQTDSNGNPCGMLSAGEDITQKHYFASLEMLRSQAMQSALEGAPLTQIFDRVLQGIEALNPGAKCSILLLDESRQNLLGCSAPSLPDAYNQIIDGIEIGDGVGSCGTAAFRQERIIVEDIQQHPYWAAFKELAAEHNLGSCWSEPIFGKKGRLLGTFAIYHAEACAPIDKDLSLIASTADFVSLLIEEQQTEADLKRMATTDDLTRLPNRRKFLKRLNSEFVRARRYNRPLSLCMLDLDHFKKINDSYGHDAGDQVLRTVADMMQQLLRETDMAGRLGGEEFGILLPDTGEDDAMILAERLRNAIADAPISYQTLAIELTVSVGVTSLGGQPDISQASELLSAADHCLYFAKQNGRNRISNTPARLHG